MQRDMEGMAHCAPTLVAPQGVVVPPRSPRPLVEGLGRGCRGTIPDEMIVEGNREAVQCMVCRSVPWHPLRCPGQCGKIWCHSCAGRWLQDHPTCPVCRDRVAGGVQALHSGWGLALDLVDMVRLRCPYSTTGCKVEGGLDAILRHVDPPAGERACAHSFRGAPQSTEGEAGERDVWEGVEGPPRARCRECDMEVAAPRMYLHVTTECQGKGGREGVLGEVECKVCEAKVERGRMVAHLLEHIQGLKETVSRGEGATKTKKRVSFAGVKTTYYLPPEAGEDGTATPPRPPCPPRRTLPAAPQPAPRPRPGRCYDCRVELPLAPGPSGFECPSCRKSSAFGLRIIT